MTTGSISILGLIWGASWLVKLVLLLLIAASVWSWSIIFNRRTALKKTQEHSLQFTKKFWSGTDLASLYQTLSEKEEGSSALFRAGYQAFLKFQDSPARASVIIENVERAMHVALSRENTRLENNLTILASVGSVSPYIGLFGTVWGIMSAFIALGAVEQATLSMVAPGIAEALIATAMGLFSAIPAVIAYNRFSALIESQLTELENFQDEFVNVLARQLEMAGRP